MHTILPLSNHQPLQVSIFILFVGIWEALSLFGELVFKFSKMKNGGFQAMSLYLVPVIRKIDLNFYYTVFWEQPVCLMFSFSVLDGIFVNIRLQFYYIIFIFSLFYCIFIPLIPSLSLSNDREQSSCGVDGVSRRGNWI